MADHRPLSAHVMTRRNFLARSACAASGALVASKVFALDKSQVALGLRIAPVTFEVSRGRFVQTTAYNGNIASVIRMPEGAPVMIHIDNQSDHQEYVHWHGFNVEASLDGTAEEGSLSVEPHQKLSYVMPPQKAGSCYVHSHAMTHHNPGGGMYGGQFAFVYVDPSRNHGNYDREFFLTTHEWEPYWANEAQEERAIEEMHHLRIDPEEGEESHEGWDLSYRVASINGKAFGHGEPLRVKQGEKVLFHLLNASATENVQLALAAHEFEVLSLDGKSVPNPRKVPVLNLGVGERVDALVEMNAPGVWVLGSTDEDVRNNGTGIVVEYAGSSGDPVWVDATGDWNYADFGHATEDPAGQRLTFGLQRMPLCGDGMEQWSMMSADGVPLTETIHFRQGSTYRLIVRNESDEWHPMHLHRSTFELVRYKGKSTGGLIKDTVVVPPFDEVELKFRPQQRGPALFHCHNQMHMDAGMQVLFDVG